MSGPSPSQPTSPQVGLQAEALRVRFGGIEALAGVSLRCETGQVLGVIGPNGAGKSTLFNAICGLTGVTSGHVSVFGQRLGERRWSWQDLRVTLLLSAAVMVGTSNMDALWRQGVVEPFRVSVMATRRGEQVPSTSGQNRTRSAVANAWLGAPYIHAEREQFCLRDARDAVIGCRPTFVAAQALSSTWQQQHPDILRRHLYGLVLKAIVVTAMAAAWWRRRQKRAAWSPRALAAAGVARTFQNIRLFDELSVEDNVRVVLENLEARGHRPTGRVVAATTPSSVTTLLARVGLADKRRAKASELSYGERRRLEIARALALAPRVLLLDEPAAGLHAGETAELLALVRQLRHEGLAILLIEHDMTLVMAVSDRVVVLDHGVQIAAGTPAQVRADRQVIAAYLGDGAATLPDPTVEAAPC